MQIIRRLESLRQREHTATVELIAALCECQRTRAFADAGHGSVWQMLVRWLKYSPAAASRRNAAMRCALRFPVVLEMLRGHRTTLSALHKVSATLLASDDPAAMLRAIDGATQDEVERIVASARPTANPVERVRRRVVKRAAIQPPLVTSREPARSAAELTPTSDPPVEHRVQLSFSLTAADHARLERLKSRLSGKYPRGMTQEQLVLELMAIAERTLDPKPRRSKRSIDRSSSAAKRSRHVPVATRRAVATRDDHRCTFTAPDGTRCDSTHDLEIDHVVPFSQGGTHDPTNLRLLCATHNRRRTEVEFGGMHRATRRGP